MTYNPYWCVICNREEDNGWGNRIGDIFKKILIDKGYCITDYETEICPDCLVKIIKQNTDND